MALGLYGTLNPPPALYNGDQSPNLVIAAGGDAQGAAGGLNTTGSRSERFAVPRGDGNIGPFTVSVELVFNGNPGAINFQVQEAHGADALTNYVTLATGGTITTAALSPDGVNYIATADFEPFAGSHLLLFCSAQSANNVKLTSARIYR